MSSLGLRVDIALRETKILSSLHITLIEAVAQAGSISAAGRVLGMSYRRTWLLVAEVNGFFIQAVVVARAGGTRGGGAEVTEFGSKLLASFRRIEKQLQAQ